jgi:putative transposase
MKSCPEFPDRFDSFEHARAFCSTFFGWYNDEHRHSGVAYLTPADVHYGRAPEILAQRQIVMNEAFARHPERFVAGAPKVPALPKAVWINPPENQSEIELGLH